MVFWGKAYAAAIVCVSWCFLWIFIGGTIIILAIFTPIANSSEIPERIIVVIIGLIIIGLPFNTAFFKLFPETINKAEISWGEAFGGSVSYFGGAVGWGLFFILLPIGGVVGSIGIRGVYYQTLGKMINGEEIEGKSAWRASGHMFGWVLLWALIGGIIIGYTNAYIIHNDLGYYNEISLFIIAIIIALFLMILGISAAEFKELGDVITYEEITWEDAYRNAVKYAVLCILWLIVGGLIIYLGFYPTMNPPLYIPPNEHIYFFYVYPISISTIGMFILSWGCLSAYIKYFGDILETW